MAVFRIDSGDWQEGMFRLTVKPDEVYSDDMFHGISGQRMSQKYDEITVQ